MVVGRWSRGGGGGWVPGCSGCWSYGWRLEGLWLARVAGCMPLPPRPAAHAAASRQPPVAQEERTNSVPSHASSFCVLRFRNVHAHRKGKKKNKNIAARGRARWHSYQPPPAMRNFHLLASRQIQPSRRSSPILRTRANIQASSVDIYSDGLLESCKVGLSSIVVLLGRSLILCPAGVRKSL